MLGFDPVVAVPGLATAVPELDVPDAAFDESPRDQDLFACTESPYISRVACDSWLMSKASLASICMR